MMGEALQFIHGLNPTPEAIIKRMTEAVHRHTGDAEQTDDITMLAIRYLKHPAGILYQRSMSLPNDIKEMPQLTHFGEEVCKAMRFDQQTTSGICLTLEEAIADIMDYAYPEGAKGDIHIETYASDTQLKFVVRDYGVPFDPTATIAHQNMDSIHYERISLSAEPVTDGQKEQNVLTLIKNIKNKN